MGGKPLTPPLTVGHLKGLAGRESAPTFRVCGFTRVQGGVKARTHVPLSPAFSVLNGGWLRAPPSLFALPVLLTLTDAQTRKL